MIILSVVFFLGVSLLFYVLFAGADFGAGILELFLDNEKIEQRKVISRAMAPVWEANHVWLILAVVILFMGFPELYIIISTFLYIPLMAILIGIVARGTAFTFRHYDTLGNKYYPTYTRIFAISSLWTPFFLGITAGAMMLGRISLEEMDFTKAYICPWLNWFCAAMGVFTSVLFAFLASVYLLGESTTEDLRNAFRKKAQIGNIAVLFSGALVFISAEIEGFPLFQKFFSNPICLSCFGFSTALWLPFWKTLQQMQRTVLLRALAITIVILVMIGWFAVRYPVIIETSGTRSGTGLTLQSVAAPEATLKALLGALFFGSVLIFPSLAYLFKVFKWETIDEKMLSTRD